MIHPNTTIRYINDVMGVGVYATACIPRGTLTVVPDFLDRKISPHAYTTIQEPLKSAAEKVMYHDREGTRVLSWDHAKYLNHSCNANTMMTAYGVEIAVRDIDAGDELTSEYGLLNVQEGYRIACTCDRCAGHLNPDMVDHLADAWDELIACSLLQVGAIDQPLRTLVSDALWSVLMALKSEPDQYRSVRMLTWRRSMHESRIAVC